MADRTVRHYHFSVMLTENDGVCECHGAPPHVHVAERDQLEASLLHDALVNAPLSPRRLNEMEERMRAELDRLRAELTPDKAENVEWPDARG